MIVRSRTKKQRFAYRFWMITSDVIVRFSTKKKGISSPIQDDHIRCNRTIWNKKTTIFIPILDDHIGCDRTIWNKKTTMIMPNLNDAGVRFTL